MNSGLDFSPSMIFIMVLSFLGISFFMGMLVHSSFLYEDKGNLKQNSKKAWVLSMAVGIGITGWMIAYGYYMNFL